MNASRHRRSRSDGGFSPDQIFASNGQQPSYGLPRSRLASVRKATDFGFDVIQEESNLDGSQGSMQEKDAILGDSTKSQDVKVTVEISPSSSSDSAVGTGVELERCKSSSANNCSSSSSTSSSGGSGGRGGSGFSGGSRSSSGSSSSGGSVNGGPGEFNSAMLAAEAMMPRQPEGSRPPRPNAARHRRIRSDDLQLQEAWDSEGLTENSSGRGQGAFAGFPPPVRSNPLSGVFIPPRGQPSLGPMMPGMGPPKAGPKPEAAIGQGAESQRPLEAPFSTAGRPGHGDGGATPTVSEQEGQGRDSETQAPPELDEEKAGIWNRRHKNKEGAATDAKIGAISVHPARTSPKSPPGGHLGRTTPPRSPAPPPLSTGLRAPSGGAAPYPPVAVLAAPKTSLNPSPHRKPGAPLAFDGPGLVIPNRSASPFTSPYGSPFTSPRTGSGIAPSPRVGSSPGSIAASPGTMAAQVEVDRVKLMEIQNMFQFKQSWQSPRVEGRPAGPYIATPVRTPNVSDYYRVGGEDPAAAHQVYLPAMACVLRKQFRDVREVYHLSDRELGRGNFGVIRVAERLETGERFACKTISKEKLECWEDVDDVKREVQIMEALRGHPHIVSIVDSFEDHQEVHLVMELCEGGELFDRILERGYYAERQAAKVCRTLVEVLDHVHARGVVHRDLKPENVLLASAKSDTRVKVIDFGMAITLKPGERCRLRAGTPNYIAPEVIAKNYGHEADVWSVGVILYVLLCGLPPFWGDTTEDVFKSVLTQQLDFETDPWPTVSAAAKDLVRRMLTRDYKKRISTPDILNHPWIKMLT